MKKHLLLFLFPFLCFSQNAKEIAKKCMNSTVSLIMEDKFKQPLSLGSGFIVEEGKVITNLHVIEDAKFGYAVISGENKLHKIEGYFSVDSTNDLALLSVPTLKGDPLRISDNTSEIGEKIYVIGNPKGLSGTISDGIISGIRTFDGSELLQITAPISPGSSGGPVINNNGQLVGVSVGAWESGQNLNFAIPNKYVLNIIQNKSIQIEKLNIKSLDKSDDIENSDVNVESGVQITNLEWYKYEHGNSMFPFKRFDYLLALSIQNNLEYSISDVKLLFILYDKNGRPVDYGDFEPLDKRYEEESIRPFLSKYIHLKPRLSYDKRYLARKPGERLEIRVLDYSIEK